MKKIFKNIIYAFTGALIIAAIGSTYDELTSYKAWPDFISNGVYYSCPYGNWEKRFWESLINSPPRQNKVYSNFDRFKDIRGTRYENYAHMFTHANSDKDVYKIKHQINLEQENCKVLVNAKPIQRFFIITFIKVMQPLHLIFGWFLVKALSEILKYIKNAYVNYIAKYINKIFYIFRGIFRRLWLKLKSKASEYEDDGK